MNSKFSHINCEFNNHLGKVLTVINDIAYPLTTDSTNVTGYEAGISYMFDYSPFGVQLNGRIIPSGDYRYGFNGMEKDDEVKGKGNSYNYKKRMFDPRLGKFLSIDPLTGKFPFYSPYQFAGNKPTIAIDLDGKEELVMVDCTFIPQNFADNPWFTTNFTSESFAGDDRYYYKSEDASYRTEQKVVLDFDNMKVKVLKNKASRTHGLDKNGEVIKGQVSKSTRAGTITVAPVTTMKSNMHYTVVNIKVNAANKLVSGASKINYDLTIFIQPSEDKKSFNYKIEGLKDGFPAFELWIIDKTNNKSHLLINYTPTDTGDTESTLFPPMEDRYNLQGDSRETESKTEVQFEETENTEQSDGGN